MDDFGEDVMEKNDKLSPSARYDDQGLIFTLIFGVVCMAVMLIITLFLHYTPVLWIKRLYRPNHTREPSSDDDNEEAKDEVEKGTEVQKNTQVRTNLNSYEQQQQQQLFLHSDECSASQQHLHETEHSRTNMHKRRGISLPFRSTFFILPSFADWWRVEEKSVPHIKLNTELSENSAACNENSKSTSNSDNSNKSNTAVIATNTAAAEEKEVQASLSVSSQQLPSQLTKSKVNSIMSSELTLHSNDINDKYKTPLDPQAAVYLFSLKYFIMITLAGLLFTIWITVIAHGDNYIDWYLLRRDPNKCHEQDANETECNNLAPRCAYLGQDIGCSPVALRGVYDMTVQNIQPRSWRWWPVAILNVLFAISFVLITVWSVRKLNGYVTLITQQQLKHALGYRVACVRGVDSSLLTSPNRFREVFLSEQAYFPSSHSSTNTHIQNNGYTDDVNNDTPVVTTHGSPVSIRRATLNRVITTITPQLHSELHPSEQPIHTNTNNNVNNERYNCENSNSAEDDSEDVYEQIDCAGVGCLFSIIGCHYYLTRRCDATFTQHPDKVKHILFTKNEPRHMYKYIHEAEHAMERLQEVIAIDKVLQRRLQRRLARITASPSIPAFNTINNNNNNNNDRLLANRRLSEPILDEHDISNNNNNNSESNVNGDNAVTIYDNNINSSMNIENDKVIKFENTQDEQTGSLQNKSEKLLEEELYDNNEMYGRPLPADGFWKTKNAVSTQLSLDSNSALLDPAHLPHGNETVPSYAATSDTTEVYYTHQQQQQQEIPKSEIPLVQQQGVHVNENKRNTHQDKDDNNNRGIVINTPVANQSIVIPHAMVMMYARLPWWCSLIRNNSIINSLSGHSKNLLGNKGMGYYFCCSCCCFCKCCPWYHSQHKLVIPAKAKVVTNNNSKQEETNTSTKEIAIVINTLGDAEDVLIENEEIDGADQIKEAVTLESNTSHGFGLCKRIPALPHYEDKFRRSATKLNTCIDQVPHERSSGPVFVVFSDSRSAFEFINLFTARFGGFFSNMSARIAGPPGRVITANLHVNHFLDVPRFFILGTVFVLLLFFWSVPVGVLGSLDNIAMVPGIGPQLNVYYHEHIPLWLRNIATAYLPVMVLAIFNTVLPLIIRFIVLTMGAFNKNERDGGHLYLQYLFMVLTTVIFQAALQGGLKQLANLVISPDGEAITNFFVSCVTPTGGYWYAKVISAATLANWLEVIDPVPLVKALLLRNAVSMQRSYDELFEAPFPEWPQRYSVDLVMLAMGLLFHMTVPLLNAFVLVYFVIRYYTQRGRLCDRHSAHELPCHDCTDFGLIAQVVRNATLLFCLAEMGGVLLMSLRRHTGGVVLNSITLASGFGVMFYVHVISSQWVVSLNKVRELMPIESVNNNNTTTHIVQIEENGNTSNAHGHVEEEEEEHEEAEGGAESERNRYLQREEVEGHTTHENENAHMSFSPLTNNTNRYTFPALGVHSTTNNVNSVNNLHEYSSYGVHRAYDESLADGYPNMGLDMFGDPHRNPFTGHLLPRRHEPHSRYQPKHQRLAHIDVEAELHRMHAMEFVVHRYWQSSSNKVHNDNAANVQTTNNIINTNTVIEQSNNNNGSSSSEDEVDNNVNVVEEYKIITHNNSSDDTTHNQV